MGYIKAHFSDRQHTYVHAPEQDPHAPSSATYRQRMSSNYKGVDDLVQALDVLADLEHTDPALFGHVIRLVDAKSASPTTTRCLQLVSLIVDLVRDPKQSEDLLRSVNATAEFVKQCGVSLLSPTTAPTPNAALSSAMSVPVQTLAGPAATTTTTAHLPESQEDALALLPHALRETYGRLRSHCSGHSAETASASVARHASCYSVDYWHKSTSYLYGALLRARLVTPKCVFFSSSSWVTRWKGGASRHTEPVLLSRVPKALFSAHVGITLEVERDDRDTFPHDLESSTALKAELTRLLPDGGALVRFSRRAAEKSVVFKNHNRGVYNRMDYCMKRIDKPYTQHVTHVVDMVREAAQAMENAPTQWLVDTFSPLMPPHCEVVLLRTDARTFYTGIEWEEAFPNLDAKNVFGGECRMTLTSIATFEDDTPEEDQNPLLMLIPLEARKMVRYVPPQRTHGDVVIRDLDPSLSIAALKVLAG